MDKETLSLGDGGRQPLEGPIQTHARRQTVDVDVDEAMCTAWLLRETLMPLTTDKKDVVVLAASFPAALWAPAVRWHALNAAPTPQRMDRLCGEALSSWVRANPTKELPRIRDLLHGSDPRRDVDADRVSAFRQHQEETQMATERLGSLQFVLGHGDCANERFAAPARYAMLSLWCIARRGRFVQIACDYGLANVLELAALDPYCLGTDDALEAHALFRACRGGHLDVLRVLAGRGYMLAHDDAADGPPFALEAACSNGHAEIVEELTTAPYELTEVDASPLTLACACIGGNAEVIRLLGEEPYGLGREDALLARDDVSWYESRSKPADGRTPVGALYYATTADAVAALAEPPFLLGYADARIQGCGAFLTHCADGNADVVRALSRAPYLLGAQEAREGKCRSLYLACKYGRLDVATVLGEPPFSLTGEDARANLNEILSLACRDGRIGVVRLLGNPPYSLSGMDAVCLLGGGLFAACRMSRLDIVEVLVAPPYSVARDAIAEKCAGLLVECCSVSGNAAIVRRISRPPFSLGRDDAAKDRAEALRMACACGDAEIVRILGETPYSLGHGDAVSHEQEGGMPIGPLITACVRGNVDIVAMLGEPPYSLDQDDAMAFDGFAMRVAYRTNAWDAVVDALAKPPYLLCPHYRDDAEQQEALMHGEDVGEERAFVGPERIVNRSRSIWR